MLRTNIDKLVMQSVQGCIKHPVTANPYYITGEGKPITLPAMGGITYNVKTGDPVFGWAGDHIEPGVTIKNEEDVANDALSLLSCIGNEATVISGDAKGTKGYVTGTHGGVEHVIINFDENLEKMVIGDSVMIKAWGQGLELLDYPNVKVMNISPDLFLKLGIREEDGKLKIPVAGIVPAYLMGSGIGTASSTRGDFDIMTTDMDEIKRNGLDQLRFGDIVLIKDFDSSYGRAYLKGAATVGVVIHGDCVRMGHGPGVTAIMTCKESLIEGFIDKNANISTYIRGK
ncbi:DUF4438 domain-containing protein [Pseudoclostridium thermosuccinogenes]|jgi:ribosomal protein L35AE/L33A|uniref:DUF4438 domain-containing protein n=1 Tax=Clostridium thermosuccinogenes TaxID=84032 RepID=UPI000CCC086E|nr:DUF4438 domain-containing protein [Pseudoclostridium thermosuccinogenes]PNT93277.1 DUF4438 domain-containing protein [Pseudoclostridium thermosuccinogenes]